MPLESAATIDQLDPTNPVATDPEAEGDDHLRLVKGALKGSFPNLVGPTTATAADLSAAADTRTRLVALEGSALRNTGGVISGDVIAHDITATGNMNALGGLYESGKRLMPRGIITLWYGSTASVPAGWQLCDGTNGAPDLRDRFVIGAGATFANGQLGGAASSTVSTTNAGNHNHGALTTPGGAHTHAAASDEQGIHAHGGVTQAHRLTVDELPSHAHETYTVTSGSGATTSGFQVAAATGTPTGSAVSNSIGNATPHTHGIDAGGAHSHNITVGAAANHVHNINADGDHAHSVTVPTVPPFVGMVYIMKS